MSPGEVEGRFWEAEDNRTELYEKDRCLRQYNFAVATPSWTKTEDGRHETIQKLFSEAMETFTITQERRVSQLAEMLDKHDNAFRLSDEARQQLLDDAIADHARTFQESQESRKEQLSKIFILQEGLFEEGRSRRWKDCEELTQQTRELFKNAMQEVEGSFAKRQRGREERIKRSQVRPILSAGVFLADT